MSLSDFLKEFWTDAIVPTGVCMSISLSGEEKCVMEGYYAAKEGANVNPYSGKKSKWWQRGWTNYQNSSFT